MEDPIPSNQPKLVASRVMNRRFLGGFSIHVRLRFWSSPLSLRMELKHDGNAEASSLTANRCRLIHLGGDRDFFVALNLFTYQLD